MSISAQSHIIHTQIHNTMTSIPATTHESTITLGEIIDISGLIQTSNGDAYVTKIVTDTGEIVSVWRNDKDPVSPALSGLKVGDEVGLCLDIKITPDLATGKQTRKVYAKCIKLARAKAFMAAKESEDA
jgi:hypothetical protein